MKKFLFFLVTVCCFGLAQAQAPADAVTFSAEEVLSKSQTFVLTFNQLNDDVLNVMNELKSSSNGFRQLFTDVTANPAGSKVTVKVTDSKMSGADLTNYLKGYFPQAMARSQSVLSVE